MEDGIIREWFELSTPILIRNPLATMILPGEQKSPLHPLDFFTEADVYKRIEGRFKEAEQGYRIKRLKKVTRLIRPQNTR